MLEKTQTSWKVKLLALALMAQILALAYTFNFLAGNGYLPAPFVFDKSDTFMDLFNTMWWGAQDYRYTEWASVYPPLNFIFLDLLRTCFAPIGIGRDPVDLRATALTAGYFIALLHLVAPFLVTFTSEWSKFSKRTRLSVAFYFAISPIFLFSLERGNLIVLALFILPFLLGKGREDVSPYLLAILINLKPYFALLMLAYLFKGEFVRFLQAMAAAGALFIFTGLMVDPNFPLFIGNIFSFASGDVLAGRDAIALPASLSAFSYAISMFLKTSNNPGIFESGLPAVATVIDSAHYVVLLFATFTLFSARREMELQEAFLILLAIAIVAGVWAGGYSQIFYIAFVPVIANMRFKVVHLSMIILIFLPWDLITIFTDKALWMKSFISHSAVGVRWQLSAGSLVRPVLNALLIISICAELLARTSQKPETSLA